MKPLPIRPIRNVAMGASAVMLFPPNTVLCLRDAGDL